MAQVDYWGGQTCTSTDAAAAATITLTLTGAGANNLQQITDLTFYAIGTVTAFSIIVTKNDAVTVLTRIGGQIGGAATGPLGPYGYHFTSPINCVAGDNAKIILTATGATAVSMNVNWKFATL